MDITQLKIKILSYSEIYYMGFILILNGLASAGLTSEDRIYKVLFVIAVVLLLLKVITTQYTTREWMWIGSIAAILGICFFRNHEKTLILAMMGIFGCKNVSIKKILQYALFSKVVFTVATVTLAVMNIIPNEIIELPKGGGYFSLYCYGYYSPNTLFANLFLICIMVVAVYQTRVKSWMFVGMTLCLYIAYKVLMCRTGMIVWAVFVAMLAIYYFLRNTKLKKIYLYLILIVPLICGLLTVGVTLLYANGNVYAEKINSLLTGRIDHIARFGSEMNTIFIVGHFPREPFDSMYVHLYYNYGIILFVIVMVGYVETMYYAWRSNKDYELLILGIMSIYGFMEQFPLNITWNLFLLYMSWMFFNGNPDRRQFLC